MSAKGAGIIIRADSKFLNMIQIGQELDAVDGNAKMYQKRE